jgi:hypothetical protein
MKTMSRECILTLISWVLFCALLAAVPACSAFGEETRTCSITCFSRSTGNNLGTASYDNYTREECGQALENRQTSLTECSLAWE